MQHVQETNLAWSLIEAVAPELNARERNHVFICVGAGDSFTAIRILLKLIEVKHIPVSASLFQLCVEWLEAYVLHEDHDRLELILADLTLTRTDPRPWASIRCMRSPASVAIAPDIYHDRNAAPRAG